MVNVLNGHLNQYPKVVSNIFRRQHRCSHGRLHQKPGKGCCMLVTISALIFHQYFEFAANIDEVEVLLVITSITRFENVSYIQVLTESKIEVMNYFLFLTIYFTLIPDYSSLLVVLYFQKVVQVN